MNGLEIFLVCVIFGFCLAELKRIYDRNKKQEPTPVLKSSHYEIVIPKEHLRLVSENYPERVLGRDSLTTYVGYDPYLITKVVEFRWGHCMVTLIGEGIMIKPHNNDEYIIRWSNYDG